MGQERRDGRSDGRDGRREGHPEGRPGERPAGRPAERPKENPARGPRRRRRQPPDRMRGPTRPLSERAAGYAARLGQTDRAARFRERRDDVEDARRSRARRRRWVLAVGIVLGTAAAAVVGWAIAGWFGALVGVAGETIVVLGRLAAQWLARRRGARAWNPVTQRYQLFGDPSRDVYDGDPPDLPPIERLKRGG